jgi:serine protease Do
MKCSVILTIISFSICLFSCGGAPFDRSYHMVSAVLDGNTIEVDGRYRVHLIGIQNTNEAKRFLENNIYRRKVRIIFDSQSGIKNAERYDKLIPGYARTLQKESINGVMLKVGVTDLDTDFLKDSFAIFQQYHSRHLLVGGEGYGNNGSGLDFVELVKEVDQAVFLVYSFNGENPIGQGTGFFIADNGTAVSNYHVFSGGDRWAIKIFEQDILIPVESILVYDSIYDYIIFKTSFNHPVKYIKLLDEYPSIGQEIFVVGNPTGLERTVSKGIVSAQRSIISEKDYFQIDAAVSPGSSGSPVCNMHGAVLGIATMKKVDCELCNFAVGSKNIIQKLRSINQ